MYIRLTRVLLIVALAATASACALNNAILRSNSPVDLKSEGVAVISLGYAGTTPPYDAYWIKSIGLINQTGGEFTFFTSPNNMFNSGKQTLASANGTTELFALNMPPGDYEVKSVGAFSDHGPYSSRGLDRPPMTKMRFSVTAGNVVYLGSALLKRQSDNSLAYVVVDEMERDIGLLHATRPDFKAHAVSKKLLASEIPTR